MKTNLKLLREKTSLRSSSGNGLNDSREISPVTEDMKLKFLQEKNISRELFRIHEADVDQNHSPEWIDGSKIKIPGEVSRVTEEMSLNISEG